MPALIDLSSTASNLSTGKTSRPATDTAITTLLARGGRFGLALALALTVFTSTAPNGQLVQAAAEPTPGTESVPQTVSAASKYQLFVPAAFDASTGSAKDIAVKENTASSVVLGIWEPGSTQDLTKIATIEQSVGKQFGIVHWYQGWGTANAALDLALISRVANRGSVPMITWEPWDYTKGTNQPEYALAKIAGGSHDAYIRTWAKGLAGYKGEVMLRFAHEMNYTRYPWAVGVNGNTAAQYVAAWKHVRGIFAAEGATNVKFVWSPGISWDQATAFEPFFPGDSAVDWVALDGYNNVRFGPWASFSSIFGDSYKRISTVSSKPVMIAEVGCAETGGNKAQWIADMFEKDIPSLPRLKAVVWFNENWPDDGADYRMNATQATVASFAKSIGAVLYKSGWSV